ncbi:MAG TPA: hypothetical protein VF794_13730 [Archangium sp.]|jgi:hypothetical protein|uniref:hypothetical protein n=1 Tax=Archangium sp. TaxID=1872627 RepID=UPI002EDA6A68
MDASFDPSENAQRMADIIDLSLLADSRRYLLKLLDARGLSYFLQKEGQRLFHIEPAKVELVVRTAVRARAEEQPAPHPKAIEHCRKEIRRELIRRVASAMLQTGL